MNIFTRSVAVFAVFLVLVLLVPSFVSAAVSVGGSVSGPGYSVGGGVSNKGGFLGISFGNGAGGFGFGIGGCSVTICGVGGTILYIINSILVPVLFGLAFIVFLWGIAKAYIFSGGDPAKVSEGHKLVLWGVVAFAVMLSLWGLVNIVTSTFGLAGYTAPPLPRSF